MTSWFVGSGHTISDFVYWDFLVIIATAYMNFGIILQRKGM
jgi:hypothetical protein